MVDRSGGRGWRELDERLQRIPATVGSVGLLRELSLTADESAWARPALRSLFHDQVDPALPDQLLGDLRELSCSYELARFNDTPQATTGGGPPGDSRPGSSSAGWFAEWVGAVQPLGHHWTRLRPVLRDLAREVPLAPEGPDLPREPDVSLRSFVELLDALLEPDAGRLEAPLPPASGVSQDDAREWGELITSVPRGPLGAAFRGRAISFPDGVDLHFDRFPTHGELRWGPFGTGVRFQTEEPETVPVRIAACVGGYLVPARTLLETEGRRFVSRCERAFVRFSAAFAAELSERNLAPSRPGRDAGR